MIHRVPRKINRSEWLVYPGKRSLSEQNLLVCLPLSPVTEAGGTRCWC